jgi:hypothetical protein
MAVTLSAPLAQRVLLEPRVQLVLRERTAQLVQLVLRERLAQLVRQGRKVLLVHQAAVRQVLQALKAIHLTFPVLQARKAFKDCKVQLVHKVRQAMSALQVHKDCKAQLDCKVHRASVARKETLVQLALPDLIQTHC